MKRVAALILLAAMSAKAFAAQPFVVSDIRIDGLSRIAAGTVFSYLPIEKGDTLTTDSAQEAIRALFHTGFFSDVELERQGSILVIKVVERPAIAKLTLRGNKDIKTDDLKKGLKQIGLSEGETFDRLSLNRVQQELIRQYYNRGKYNVSVDPHVTRLDRNRVAIDIEVREGKAAKIKEINIVGNHAFSDKAIRDDFESNTTGWLSWYSKDDQYSREKLSGDLKKLGSYYMNRGYADFGVDSTQVAISPDKRAMYISASIKEGEIYTVSDVKLLGDLKLPEETLRKFIFIRKGDVFNRARIQASADTIKAVLANIGYAFAKVTPVPDLDKEKRTAALTFYVEPGKRVYVRRINFSGNTRTEDEVLRREFRQLEGAWYAQGAIDRSKVRLQRLGYVKNVEITNQKVPGTDDQVDLNVKLEEQSAGSVQFGIGYSQYSGVVLNASVSQRNFMGTGDRFTASAERSNYYTSVNFGYVNPYLTDSGVSIGYNAVYSKLDYGDSDLANYTNSTRAFGSFIGIPLTDFNNLQVGLKLSSNKINLTPGFSPQSFIDYQNALNHRTAHTWTLNTTFTRETRNSYWAATRGGLQQLSVNVALPGSTVQFWKAFYEGNHYWEVGKGFVFYLDGQIGYGATYGNQVFSRTFGENVAGEKVTFPFWENYSSGGVRDVRGFQDNSLGPREQSPFYRYPQPIGGAFKVLGTAQLFIPLPFIKDASTARVSTFMDVGNAYKNFSTFDASELRASVGVALQWKAPIGPLIISLAVPIRDKPEDKRYEERIQFTFGNTF